jgi:hypothetical protein
MAHSSGTYRESPDRTRGPGDCRGSFERLKLTKESMAMESKAQMMEAIMRRCLANAEMMAECCIWTTPASMRVLFHDGPGIQFLDVNGKPLLPDLIRDEEQAITLWNALTCCAPIDHAWFES